MSRQKDVKVKVSEQKYLLFFFLNFISGGHNQGKVISFVYIDLEASFEEPLTASFIYKCFIIYYMCTHGSERNNALNSDINGSEHLSSWKRKVSEVSPGYFVVFLGIVDIV